MENRTDISRPAAVPLLATAPGLAPVQVTRAAYRAWLQALEWPDSMFFDQMFDWYDSERGRPLPPEVEGRQDRLYITTRRALRDSVAFEQVGDLPSYASYGYDAYAKVDVPVSVALQTLLFVCGKPIGQALGTTRTKQPTLPFYSYLDCTLEEKWGTGSYLSKQSFSGGSWFYRDLKDEYAVLVRGVADGYAIFSSFLGPESDTKSQMAITLLTPRSDGGADIKRSLRRSGQSYPLGSNARGRDLYGFKIEPYRDVEITLAAAMKELRDTGRIRERP
jgi:hypothetical protein